MKKIKVRSYWWLVFFALNGVSTPASADESTYLKQSDLRKLVRGFAISQELDSNKNLVVSGSAPRSCQDKLSTSWAPNYRNNTLILSFIDNGFSKCISDCEKNIPNIDDCKYSPLVLSQKIPGVSDTALDIRIATNATGGIEATDFQLQSAEEVLIERLSIQATCRGKEGQTYEQNMSELLLAESAIEKLKAKGVLEDDESVREQLSAIKDKRTEYQQAKVLAFEENLETLEGMGDAKLTKSGLAKMRNDVAKFARENKGAVSDDISVLYQKIAQTDLRVNAGSFADSRSYFATVKRAQGDLTAMRKLSGVSRDGRLAQADFADGLRLHQTEYLARQGMPGMFMYQNLARLTKFQLDAQFAQSGCMSMGAQMVVGSNGVVSPSSLNERCNYLSNARNHLMRVDKYQKQTVQYQADQTRYSVEMEAFNQMQEDNKARAAELAELQQRGFQMAQAQTAQRAAMQAQRGPNGQIINQPINNGLIGSNGVVGSNGIINNGIPGNLNQQFLPNQPMAPRLPMNAPTPLANFDLFPASQPAFGSTNADGTG